ncbi:restriction endonuclease subunit S [Avibacterium paragallinarum]|uniref:restriction endonuclease subunit S n=1 Tax=Avibacterium paragallinarum TaxID=728 RepID=UPI0021F6DBC4|nr:restriction endonuclease subunit S [Avibacterium paragallinarum]UXN37468.1 restriction endonuclease subunit S [Avibacterium paragallinarum]
MQKYPLYKLCQNVSRRFDFKNHEDVIFINTGDVQENKFLHNTLMHKNELPGQAKKAIENGDILFSEIRPKNSRHKLISEENVSNYVVSTKFMVLKANNELITPEFLYILITSKNVVEYFQLIAESRSGTFPQITFEAISSYEVSIPDKAQQNIISEYINNYNRKIELNTQTNQTLEQIAQGIFKHWFIDFAPVHAKANALARGETIEQAELAAMACLSGKTVEKITALKTQDPTAYHQLQQTAAAFPSEFVETEMGKVPKGWEILKFKDFVKETKEKVGKLQGVEEYSVGNEGIYPRKEKYKKQLAKDPTKNKLIREANIVFGMGNKEVNWGIMRDKIGSVSSAYNIFQINNINHLFLEMLINNIPYYFRDIIKPTSRQGQTIDKAAFLEKTIYYPNKDILTLFLGKINQINNLISLIKIQNINIIAIRDELLPRLLSGEIEL